MYISVCIHKTNTDSVELAALVVLPSLLPDSHVKVDIAKSIQLAKVQTRSFILSRVLYAPDTV